MLRGAPNEHGECMMAKEEGGLLTEERARNAGASLPELGRPQLDTAERVGGVLPHHSLKALRRSLSGPSCGDISSWTRRSFEKRASSLHPPWQRRCNTRERERGGRTAREPLRPHRKPEKKRYKFSGFASPSVATSPNGRGGTPRNRLWGPEHNRHTHRGPRLY